MNCKINFVKISNNHLYAGVGFIGNIFIILDKLNSLMTCDKIFIDMGLVDCVCTEHPQIFGTDNCWEYYFNQCSLDNSFNELSIMTKLSGGIPNYDNCSNEYNDPCEYIYLKNLFYNHFKIKDDILSYINNYYDNEISNKKTLGVQIRLTDMKEHHRVAGLEQYISRIKEIIIIHNDIEQIFISTDDSTIFNDIQEQITLPVIYHDVYRANSIIKHLDQYDRYNDGRPQHKYLLGLECLYEVLTLTKCDYFLKAQVSAFSIVACILSENIKKIYKI